MSDVATPGDMPWFVPMPKPLWSAYLEAPFVECIDCGGPLDESPVYIIQKRVVADETVFEMAICESCRASLVSEYSQETLRNIENFLAADGGLGHRMDSLPAELMQDPGRFLDYCLNHCVVCETPRSQLHRYSVAAGGRGRNLILQIIPLGQSPMLVCDRCESGMQDLISQQTRDRWNRFVDEHFDGPPGVEVDSPWSQPVPF